MATNEQDTFALPQHTDARIPYAFAKRHGVLVEEVAPEHVDVVYREGVSSTALLEVRRRFGRPIRPRTSSRAVLLTPSR